MIWVVATNTSTCRIYHYNKKPKKLTPLKQMQHPQSKVKTSELLTDRPGHYNTRGPTRGAYEPRTGAREVEIETFSREIAKELDQGRKKNAYDTLILISPSHMSGILLQHLDHNTKNLITKTIHKDLNHMTDLELLDYLQEHTKYPDSNES